MKRLFLLLAAVALMATDVSAERMSLLDLIGGGSRRSSRSRHKAGDHRRPVRVEVADGDRGVTNAVASASATNTAAAAGLESSAMPSPPA